MLKIVVALKVQGLCCGNRDADKALILATGRCLSDKGISPKNTAKHIHRTTASYQFRDDVARLR